MAKVFKQQFKTMMSDLKYVYGSTVSLVHHPYITQGLSLQVHRCGNNCLHVKNITEKYFDRLNKTEVRYLKRTTFEKRIVQSDGSYRKDKQGNYVTKKIYPPHGSVLISSPISIGLRTYIEGTDKLHNVSEGYAYLDYKTVKHPETGVLAKEYIYYVPSKYLYPANLVSLVLTTTKLRNYYKGCRLAASNGEYIYLYVTPYRARKNKNYRVIATALTTDFDVQVNKLLASLFEKGILFDLSITNMSDDVAQRGDNLAFEIYNGTLDPDIYEPYGLSLAEKGDFPNDDEL